MRSKSEIIIANMLNNACIPYRYEYAHSLKGLGDVYTDFTILNVRLRKEVLWEHFGMMEDPSYVQRTVSKVNAYIFSGYYPGENFIFTWELPSQPLNVRMVKELIEKYCI